MSTFKDELKAHNFSEDFYPKPTTTWAKEHDKNRGTIWYKFIEFPVKNGTGVWFKYTDWHMPKHAVITSSPELKGADKKAFEATIKNITVEHDLEQIRGYEIAKQKAQKIWDESFVPREAPEYLKDKKLSDCLTNYRVDETGETLIIPIVNYKGEIESIQRITPENKENLEGGRTVGNYAVIDGAGELLFIVEGFSTGLAVHKLTGCRVLCAMSAHNLKNVAQIAYKIGRERHIVIAGDNDLHSNENVGEKAAYEAAAIIGTIVKLPVFTELDGKKTSDWLDLLNREGFETAKKQITVTEQEQERLNTVPEVVALGYRGGSYYFMSTQNQDVQCFDSIDATAGAKLIEESYWEKHFGDFVNGRVTIDWQRAQSVLFSQCHHRGQYEEDAVRGTGVYLDEGRVILHVGDKVYEDGKERKFHQIKSDRIYVPRTKINPIHMLQLEDAELKLVWDSFDKINLKDKEKKVYIFGWLVCAVLTGVLDWRPHLYITGSKGSGKTELLGFISGILQKGFNVVTMQAVHSTSKGMRQALDSCAVPIIVDEVEADTQTQKKISEDIVRFFRIASSNSAAKILLGRQNQNARIIGSDACGIMAGINMQLKEEQDLSRFCIIDMEVPRDKDSRELAKEWDKVKEVWNRIDEEWARKFVTRVITNVKTIKQNIDAYRKYLNRNVEGFPARLADQHGTLLAASVIWEHTRVLTEEEMASMYPNLIQMAKESDDMKTTNEEACLKEIIEMPIRDAVGTNKMIASILARHWFESEPIDEVVKESLNILGVVVYEKRSGEKGIFIRKTKVLDESMNKTSYSKGYIGMLEKIPGAEKMKSGGGKYRGVFIPKDSVISHIIIDQNNQTTKDVQF